MVSALGKKSIVQNLSCDSLSIVLTPDLSPAVGSFVVDPGYSPDHYQGLGRVANRTPSFLFAALLFVASLDGSPGRHQSPRCGTMRVPALGSCGLGGCPVILKDLLAQPFQLSVKIIEPDSLHRLMPGVPVQQASSGERTSRRAMDHRR